MEQHQRLVKECWEVSKIISSVSENYFNQVKSDLRSGATETTPKAPIWWGLPERIKDDVMERGDGLISFQRMIFHSLINFVYEETEWELTDQLAEKDLDLLAKSTGINFTKKTTTGKVKSTQEIIWTNNVPNELVEILVEEIEKYYENKKSHLLKDTLEKFPVFYNNLKDRKKLEKVGGEALNGKNRQQFSAIIAHELTHLYIVKNSKLKSEYLKAIDKEITETRMSSLKEIIENNEDPMTRQAKEIGFNPPLIAIEESFAFMVTKEFYSNFDLPTSGYKDGENLPWLDRIILEKMKEIGPENEVNWLRKSAVKSLDIVAKKGQISNTGERISPYFYFVDQMKPKKTSSLINDFEALYNEVWNLSENNNRVRKALKQEFGQKYSSIKPRDFYKEIKIQVYSDAINNHYSPQEIHRDCEKVIFEVSRGLNEVLNYVNNGDAPQIKKIKNDLNKLIEKDIN